MTQYPMLGKFSLFLLPLRTSTFYISPFPKWSLSNLESFSLIWSCSLGTPWIRMLEDGEKAEGTDAWAGEGAHPDGAEDKDPGPPAQDHGWSPYDFPWPIFLPPTTALLKSVAGSEPWDDINPSSVLAPLYSHGSPSFSSLITPTSQDHWADDT